MTTKNGWANIKHPLTNLVHAKILIMAFTINKHPIRSKHKFIPRIFNKARLIRINCKSSFILFMITQKYGIEELIFYWKYSYEIFSFEVFI